MPVVRALEFHAQYRCQNSGACCRAFSAITVEPSIELTLRPRLPLVRDLPNGPDGLIRSAESTGAVALRRTPEGECWFHRPSPSRCAIHAELGVEALPSACRQFPRVAVIEEGTTTVSLSHFCPTAAAALFDGTSRFGVVESPAAFPDDRPFEGLDVRPTYSPLLREGVILGPEALRRVEAGAVGILQSATDAPAAIFRIASAVAALRTWRPSDGDLATFAEGAFAHVADAGGSVGTPPADPRPALQTCLQIEPGPAFALPNGPFRPISSMPPSLDLAIRKYLAARLVGAWTVHLASDLKVLPAYLQLCLATVHLFAGDDAAAGADLASRLKEAIRASDLWILHYCDPELLARNLG